MNAPDKSHIAATLSVLPPSYKKIVEAEELPSFSRVLTAIGGPLEPRGNVGEGNSNAAICLISNDEAFIVTTDQHRTTNFCMSLLTTARRQHKLKISEGFIAPQKVIHHLNSQASAKADAVASDSTMAMDRLLLTAIERNASDIHIELRKDGARVRARILGLLDNNFDSWSYDHGLSMIRMMFSNGDAASRGTGLTMTESAQFAITREGLGTQGKPGTGIKVRAQFNPAYPDDCADLTLRIFKYGLEEKPKSTQSLGFSTYQQRQWRDMMSRPDGIIVICGTTGSGKSTTMHSQMVAAAKSNPNIKLISAEDPPENTMHGVTQIPLRKGDSSFNPWVEVGKDIMRSDPDTIMYGEIRDRDSLESVIDMAQTGHKVLTTLHAKSPLVILERMMRMGADPRSLASEGLIVGLVHQVLMPILCEHCKVPYTPDAVFEDPELHVRLKRYLKPSANIHLKGPGCPHCANLGVTSREVCAEVVSKFDRQMLRAIGNGDVAAAMDHLRASKPVQITDTDMQGATTLDHAVLKMLEGKISPLHVEEYIGKIGEGDLE